MITKCQACGKDDLLTADVGSNGSHGPILLPGMGFFSGTPYFTIFVCSDCGFVHWFVRSEDMERVKKSGSFKRIKGEQARE